MNDWNELRLVLAIARAGTLAGAAKTLRVDHSTVFRRLQALEARLGARLFERTTSGTYAPTPTGERATMAAERMEDEANALDRAITGRDHSLEGRLRVTSSETLAYRLLTAHIAAFRRAHPGIIVDLAIDNRVLSLARGEADVALRPMRPKEGDLWGRKLGDVAWCVYGNRTLFPPGHAATLRDLAAHPFIGWGEEVSGFGAAEWLAEVGLSAHVPYRSSSLINQLVAARAGLGLAVLPCYLADPEPDLARLLPQPVAELSRELWIITHADLKHTARVRAFFDHVGEALVRQRGLLEGKDWSG